MIYTLLALSVTCITATTHDVKRIKTSVALSTGKGSSLLSADAVNVIHEFLPVDTMDLIHTLKLALKFIIENPLQPSDGANGDMIGFEANILRDLKRLTYLQSNDEVLFDLWLYNQPELETPLKRLGDSLRVVHPFGKRKLTQLTAREILPVMIANSACISIIREAIYAYIACLKIPLCKYFPRGLRNSVHDFFAPIGQITISFHGDQSITVKGNMVTSREQLEDFNERVMESLVNPEEESRLIRLANVLIIDPSEGSGSYLVIDIHTGQAARSLLPYRGIQTDPRGCLELSFSHHRLLVEDQYSKDGFVLPPGYNLVIQGSQKIWWADLLEPILIPPGPLAATAMARRNIFFDPLTIFVDYFGVEKWSGGPNHILFPMDFRKRNKYLVMTANDLKTFEFEVDTTFPGMTHYDLFMGVPEGDPTYVGPLDNWEGILAHAEAKRLAAEGLLKLKSTE